MNTAKRDRLSVVVRMHELREQEALVARAVAHRRAADAAARLSLATGALAARSMPPGTVASPDGLQTARLEGMALGDQVQQATREQLGAEAAARRSDQARADAAVARRSVERLQERRRDEVERATAKRDARRDDDIALQVWRWSR